MPEPTVPSSVGARAAADRRRGHPAWNARRAGIDRREAARLDVLRALERGDLDVEAASRRLEALEEAGPSSFRGWC